MINSNPLSQYLADALAPTSMNLTTKMSLTGETVPQRLEPSQTSPVAEYVAKGVAPYAMPEEAQAPQSQAQIPQVRSNPAKFIGAKAEDASPQLYEHISKVEEQYGLPAGLLTAIKDKGEKSGSNAVSPVGARGAFQFMPATWKQYGNGDPSDPYASAEAAGRFFKDLLKQYNGNAAAAIAHYNGGNSQGRLVALGKEPSYTETRNYVRRVLA